MIYLPPATWFAVCGFPPVLSFLRKLKLEFAALLKLAKHRAGIIFKVLLKEKKGVLATDTILAIEEWKLVKLWRNLKEKTLIGFKKKIHKLAKQNWPHCLPRKGCHKWLYTITLFIQVMCLRGQIGNGRTALNGKWVGLNVTFIVW